MFKTNGFILNDRSTAVDQKDAAGEHISWIFIFNRISVDGAGHLKGSEEKLQNDSLKQKQHK